MDLQELLSEQEFRKCRGPLNASVEERLQAFCHFCENYWYIKHPERGRILFEMREAQIDTVAAWMEHRYNIALKARQIGFSTLAAAYSFWLCYFRPDTYIVMLSKTEREAVKLLAKAKYGAKYLPQWLKERGPNQLGDNVQKLAWDNESMIESLPSGNEPARGESVYLVIIDEWAFLPNPEGVWASVEPIADIGGRVIGLSTANGSGNFFHEMWLGAEQGLNNFHPLFWPYSAADRDDEWYESKKRSMQSWQLHQEYPRDANEAFIMSGNPVFDIAKLMAMEYVEPSRYALITHSKKHTDLQETEYGEFRVWEHPAVGQTYIIGADVAEGLAHGDFSCAQVVNAKTGFVVAMWHGHCDADIFGNLLAEIGWRYNNALIAPENNNHGLTTIKALQRYGYKNVFRQRRLANRIPAKTEIMGWRTTAASKPLAIDELGAAIREDTIYIRDRQTIAELKSFVRDENGKTHGSPHDDCVMSLAICWQMMHYVWLTEYRGEVEAPRYSLDWWGKLSTDPDMTFKRVPIGSHNARAS